MSISHYFQGEGRSLSLRLPKYSDLVSLLRTERLRSNRIDQEYLPEGLRRDIGLIDGRGSRGRTERSSHEEWPAASLMHPPRGL